MNVRIGSNLAHQFMIAPALSYFKTTTQLKLETETYETETENNETETEIHFFCMTGIKSTKLRVGKF